jgi:hypothetical protein
MTSILKDNKGVYIIFKPASIALTTKEDLDLYYQKKCRMHIIMVKKYSFNRKRP